ncbi:MAG: T9SS type A sorting domain-containing protein [Bacteroidia bacterium]|nr:T9SS type A sorting domain-containing protein [Bacteroidia bacterium]
MIVKFYPLTWRFLTACCLLLLAAKSNAQVSAYNFTQMTGTYTAITGGTVIATASGTSGAASLDDVIYDLPAGTIPFSFQFNSTAYTGCKVSTNGFITFGATAPSANGSTTGYTPISATTAYSGAASALGRNLNAYFFSGVPAQTGELRYQTLGTTPNRTFVIQWKNFKTFNTSGATFGPVLNFQVRLKETSNAIEFVYNCSGAFTSSLAQVGLRGATNGFPSNVNNRSVANGVNTWINSVAGTSNAATCEFSSSLMPPSGLTYSFAPSACPSPQNAAATNITQNSAQLTWTSPGGNGTFTIEYGLSGFSPGNGTTQTNVSSGVVINGLVSTTNYQYYIRQECGVNGNSSLVGPIDFSTGGPGEDCATALLVNVANNLGACAFTTVNSGVSSNGPNAICSDFNGNGANDDKWYRFVAPSGGNQLVITTTAGTVNDWVMEVWNGCPGSGLMLKCADDVNGTMPEITLCQNEYTAGQTYYIRIWTYSTAAIGTANLCVYKTTACPLPPVNDECISATRLTVNSPLACPASATSHSNAYATPNTDGATCDAGTKRDVWFVFNTGNLGNIVMTISPGTATTLKAQLLFECGGFEISCYSPANGTYTFTGLNPQADYVIRVWSDSGTAGTFNICLADQCANPTATFGPNQAVCTGQTASLPVSFTGVPPYTFTYKNNTTNQNFPVTTSLNPYNIQLSPSATTTYTLLSMNDAACSGTASGTASVTVVSPQAVSLSAFPSTCTNSPLVTLTQGSPAGGVYSGVGVSGVKFNPAVGTQTITYTVTFAPGCVDSASQVFTVHPLPNVSLNSLGNVCLTAAPFPLTGGVPTGGTYSGPGVSNNTFNPASAGLGNKIITYSFTSTAGCTSSDTALITVITCSGCANPPVANAGPDRISCEGSQVSLAGSISGGANSASWVGNGTGFFTPNNTTLTATYVPSSTDVQLGQIMLILTTNDPDGGGPCVPDKDTMMVFFQDSIAANSITGTTGVCRPVNGVTYSVASQAGASYNWTVPTNVVLASGQGTAAITANWPSNGQAGNVCVTMSNGCNSKQLCKNVKLRTTAAGKPTSIKGQTSACRNEVFTYSCSRVSSADFYVWTPPVGATINGSGASFQTVDTFVVVTFGAAYTGDTLRVKGGNCAGFSAETKLRINRRTTVPGTPSAISGEGNGVCASTQVYSIKPTNGASSYRWRTAVAGALINGLPSPLITNDTLVTVTWPSGFASGTLFVAARNACGTGTEKSKTIKGVPGVSSGINGNDTVCAGTSQVYSIAPLYGATSYTWTVPSSVTIQSGQGTTSITVKFNAATGTRAIKVKGVNACGNGSNKTLNVQAIACPRNGDLSIRNAFGIDAYPNPASDLLNIQFESASDENYRIMLYDLTGRMVQEQMITAVEGVNTLQWSLSGYPAGVYLLAVQGREGLSQVKIVVEK